VPALLVTLPLLLPLATACGAALASARPRLQQAVSLTGAIAGLVSAVALLIAVNGEGTAAVTFGGWDAPFGIAFAADRLGALLVVLAALMGVSALVFQRGSADPAPASPTLLPLVHALVAGVSGAFLTADLFNLYVWFEVMLMASLGLLALGLATRHLEAALTYFVLNAVGTLLLLIAVASIYGVTGHLNLAAIARAAAGIDAAVLAPLVVALALALLVKAGAFPVFSWLPAAYHTLPAPVLALFAALLTKVGVYAVLRVSHVFASVPGLPYDALGWIAAATMIAGVLGAAYHWDMRRILAFHSVSQVGYMLLGIALATPGGATGTIVFAVHHSLVKANLFFIAAITARLAGSYDLRRIGGLYAARPWLGALFLLQALSLVGVPPLSGFWAKVIIVRESLALGRVAWAVVALAVGLLTLYSMLKIWFEAFWKPHPEPGWAPVPAAQLAPAYTVAVGLAVVTTAIGLAPEPLIRFAAAAAAGLTGAVP